MTLVVSWKKRKKLEAKEAKLREKLRKVQRQLQAAGVKREPSRTVPALDIELCTR